MKVFLKMCIQAILSLVYAISGSFFRLDSLPMIPNVTAVEMAF